MSNKTQRPSFADVKAASLKDISRVLAHWLPNGKRVDGGKEYTAPNPTRTDKRAGSLKVNLSKGTWADFATDDKGGDLIDLVRYLDGGTDIEACNKLAELLRVTAGAAQSKPSPNKSKPPEWLAIQPIPAEAMNKCPAKHRQHGAPSKVWMYRDAQGQPVMALYRFDFGPDEDGKPRKVFAPLTWCQRADGQTQNGVGRGCPSRVLCFAWMNWRNEQKHRSFYAKAKRPPTPRRSCCPATWPRAGRTARAPGTKPT